MFRRKKIDVTLTEAKDANEAMNFGWICVKYFLIKHTFWTLVALAFIFGGILYVGFDYYKKYQFHKMRIEKQINP